MLALVLNLSAGRAAANQPHDERLAASSTDGGSEIVVTSDSARQVATDFVEEIDNPEQQRDEPMARFAQAVCVGSAGLPIDAAQSVVDRVSEVARSVGLQTGGPDCLPNIMVIFTDDTKQAMRALRRKRSGALNGQTRASIDRIIEEPGDARSWIEVETRSRDGEKLLLAPNEPAILNIASQSRLVSPIRRDIVSATVLIERSAAADRSLLQMAEYAAVRALTGARSHGRLQASSILSAFTPDGDDRAPPQMTRLDRGYLNGLYAGTGNILPGMKRHQIARQIAMELAR